MMHLHGTDEWITDCRCTARYIYTYTYTGYIDRQREWQAEEIDETDLTCETERWTDEVGRMDAVRDRGSEIDRFETDRWLDIYQIDHHCITPPRVFQRL